MKHRIVFLVLCSLVASRGRAATDPLGAAFAPSIDTNCSDSQYAPNIWLTDTMQKVRQDSGTPASNACYLTVHGTQNEFADFQVHLHDTGSGTANMSVTVSNFVQAAPGSYTISAATAPPPNIIVYREQYMNVTIKSATSNTFYNSTGYYPDILIPAVDPYWGQTTNAWPYTVAAGKNQSAWVDVLIPSGAPAGYYLGLVTVKSGSTTLATMPVILAVWQWPNAGYMPSTTTLKIEASGFGYNGLCTQMYSPNAMTGTTLCGNYPGSGGSNDGGVTATFLDGDLLMKDHRFGVSGPENIYPQAGSFASYTSLMGPILSGSSGGCTHGSSYCPVLPGAVNTTTGLGSAGNSFTQPIWCNWQSNFTKNGWGSPGVLPLYQYLQDEPHTQSDFTNVYNHGTAYHGYISSGSTCSGSSAAIPELVTTDIWLSQGSQSAANSMSTTICGSNTCVLSAFDIMVTIIDQMDPQGGSLLRANYNSWLSSTNPDGVTPQLWSYQDCESGGSCSNGTVGPSTITYPNLAIDGVPAANRAMEWLTFYHNQSGELYYATDICMVPASQGAQCGYPSHTYDPWQSVYYSGMWGDGTLVYAGSLTPSADNYMGASVKTPLILPSLRLKLIRDGVQDYEYLNALTKSGNSSFVQTEITSWVTNSYTFETTGAGLQSARLALGNFMHALTYSSSSNPPPPTGLKVITIQ